MWPRARGVLPRLGSASCPNRNSAADRDGSAGSLSGHIACLEICPAAGKRRALHICRRLVLCCVRVGVDHLNWWLSLPFALVPCPSTVWLAVAVACLGAARRAGGGRLHFISSTATAPRSNQGWVDLGGEVFINEKSLQELCPCQACCVS